MQDTPEPQLRNEPTNSDSIEAQSPIGSSKGGERVLQPTAAILQELKTQPPAPAPPTSNQNVITPPPAPYRPGMPPTNPSLTNAPPVQPTEAPPADLSSGSRGKRLVAKGLLSFVGVGALLAVLVFTNVIAFSRFSTVGYTTSKGAHYTLLFYTKHTSKTLRSGNTQLISKVSQDGKFPITLSIATGTASSYSRAKDCTSFTKAFDVQNDNVGQKISVCSVSISQSQPDSVYVAAILYHDQTSVITIGQDLSRVDLSSSSGAQKSLSKFGLQPYQEDIKKIVASIAIQ